MFIAGVSRSVAITKTWMWQGRLRNGSWLLAGIRPTLAQSRATFLTYLTNAPELGAAFNCITGSFASVYLVLFSPLFTVVWLTGNLPTCFAFFSNQKFPLSVSLFNGWSLHSQRLRSPLAKWQTGQQLHLKYNERA